MPIFSEKYSTLDIRSFLLHYNMSGSNCQIKKIMKSFFRQHSKGTLVEIKLLASVPIIFQTAILNPYLEAPH